MLKLVQKKAFLFNFHGSKKWGEKYYLYLKKLNIDTSM